MKVVATHDACECCYVLIGAGVPCEHPQCQGVLLRLAPEGSQLHSAGSDAGEPGTTRTGCELCGQGRGLLMTCYQVIELGGPWLAGVNVPGYLPEREPQRFETAKEAWEHLAELRQRDEDAAELPGDSYTQTVLDLEERAERTAADGTSMARAGTVYGATPGYEGDHDLGLAYSVSWDGDH